MLFCCAIKIKLPRSQAVRHHTLTVACASSNLAEATIIFVPLAQSVEHLTFNQRVWSSNLQRDTILCLSGEIGRRTGLKILRESNPIPVQVRSQAPSRVLSSNLVICFWRNTQVWLKGPVLKTGRSATARGFESLFLRHLLVLTNSFIYVYIAG